MPVATYTIVNSEDDAADSSNATMSVNYNRVGNGIHSGFLIFRAGLRFQDIQVPKNAVIVTVTLALEKDNTIFAAGTNYGRLYGVAADRYIWWLTRFDEIPRTSNSIAIVDGAFVVYDVTAIYKEITGRPGWAPGNPIAFVGSETGADGAIFWKDYSVSGSAQNATLYVTYEGGGSEPEPPSRPPIRSSHWN